VSDRVVILILSFLICSFLGTAMAIFVKRLLSRRERRLEQRLGLASEIQHGPDVQISQEFDDAPGLTGQVNRGFSRFFVQTGIEMAPDTAFLATTALALLMCGVVLLWRDNMLEAAGAMLLGYVLAFVYFHYRRAKRLVQIREQLPEVMELLARAVRAGESLDQAVQLVGEATPKPLGPEFDRLAQQLEMGLSINAAMRSVSRRAPVAEIRIFASTLMVQRETGGSLPTTLERLSAVIRDRISYNRQFKAATGAGRLSTLLIGIAGPLIAFYLIVFQRDYFNTFFESFAGQMMLTTSILLQIIGFIWIYRLLKSDY